MVDEITGAQFNEAIGVDLEYYGDEGVTVIALIQISSATKDYIVDALRPSVRESAKHLLGELLFENERIVKVFHGCDSDLQLLATDLDIFVRNVFDTGRAYTALTRLSKLKLMPSLELIIRKFLRKELTKMHRVAEWRIRPLPQSMLDYARCDSHYLIRLFAILEKLLSGDTDVFVGEEIEAEGWMEELRRLSETHVGTKGLDLITEHAKKTNEFSVEKIMKSNYRKARIT